MGTLDKKSYRHVVAKLKELGFATLRDYYNSHYWRATRARFLSYKNPKLCYVCGSPQFLQLHHRTYKRFTKELPCDCTWVCKDCHPKIHEEVSKVGLNVWGATKKTRRRVKRKQSSDLGT